MFKKTLASLSILAVMAVGGLGVQAAGAAAAQPERALMAPPAKNCAVVAEFPGIQDVTTKSYIRKITLNEGLVIRASRIENGKIIIPPSGLYYTTRTPKSGVLQGDKVLILGKLYEFVDQATKLDVITNVWVDKKKGVPFGDGTKHLELSILAMGANGFPVPNATFKILKQSGNYYGVAFPVATSNLFTDITSGKLNKGSGRKTGTYLPFDQGQDFETEYYASSVAVSGQTYLVADKVTPKGAQVKEFATGALRYMLLSPDAPKEALMGVGDKVEYGGFTLEITKVAANFADAKLTCKQSGKSWTKRFGPLTADVLKYMPVDEEKRAAFVLRDPSDRVQAQLNIYKAGGAFQDGKVQIAMYKDLIKLGNPSPWTPDKRFLYRPDTWSTCSMFIEGMLENDKQIVLDAANNVFVGPNGYFKVVIDKFDGKTIQAWHVEDAKGNSTGNLAARSGGTNVDLLINKDCRTVSHFMKRIALQVLAEQQKQIKELSK